MLDNEKQKCYNNNVIKRSYKKAPLEIKNLIYKGVDTMTKKITKKDRFNELLTLADVKANTELVKFIEHEIDLLNRKSSAGGEKKLTPVQKANEIFKEAILEGMKPGRLYTITELQKEIPAIASAELSNQRVNSLVKKLKDAELVKRTEEKGKAYFQKI